VAAAYGALTKAENRDPSGCLRPADLVGLEGSHTAAGYKGSTRNFNPKFLRLEPGDWNQARFVCEEAVRDHGHTLLPDTTLHQRIIVRSYYASGELAVERELPAVVATGDTQAAVLARHCTHRDAWRGPSGLGGLGDGACVCGWQAAWGTCPARVADMKSLMGTPNRVLPP